MFRKEEDETEETIIVSKGFKSIKPKKDFHIKFNEHDIKLIKGEKIEVPVLFIKNLETEGVI